MSITRRDFLRMAASFGASLAWSSAFAQESRISWQETREAYPQGVASGDPFSDSVILWTRRPPAAGIEARALIVEIAEDLTFHRVVATAKAPISEKSDWTCRVLAAGLKPRRVYWYRFTDEHGYGSRIGRTITAPAIDDSNPVAFAFVSCQNVTQGACNAYRRMIWEDEQQSPEAQLGFVLHLGDYIYEVVWYPEDRPQGMYDRKIRDIVRYPNGEKYSDFHIPTTLQDYRALYRSYLMDPDLQDARARWPFVCVWDNHEFSWKGWQSQQEFEGTRPAQKLKIAANQVWFEYQPARVTKPGSPNLDIFEAPSVENAPIDRFDEYGLGLEPGNLAAIRSLKIHRSIRYGRNVDLILTDNHSFCSKPFALEVKAKQFQPEKLPLFYPQEVMEILDAGRAYKNNLPPETIEFEGKKIANFRKDQPPQSRLGIDQKKWFLEQLSASTAAWKLWGNSLGMLDCRVDFQNLPDETRRLWPVQGYGILGGDWSAYRHERAEILQYVREKKISGFVSIAGDRHSFFAGLTSVSLPPDPFEPVGAEFITGSVSAPGLVEALSYNLKEDDPTKPLFLQKGAALPVINFSVLHGVRSSLALFRTDDIREALKLRNPDVSPHLSFVDLGGHGYSVVRANKDELQVEFVCIPRPLERSKGADGGPIAYRVTHRLKRWNPGERPQLEPIRSEGAIQERLASRETIHK